MDAPTNEGAARSTLQAKRNKSRSALRPLDRRVGPRPPRDDDSIEGGALYGRVSSRACARPTNAVHPGRGHRQNPPQHEGFRHDRTLMQMSVGDRPQAAILRSIELPGAV